VGRLIIEIIMIASPIADMVEQMLAEGVAARSWRKVRTAVLRRDMHICSYCLDDATHVDHITPVARMGAFFDPKNLTAACATCNRSKGALTASEWFDRDWGGLVPPWFRERHTQ